MHDEEVLRHVERANAARRSHRGGAVGARDAEDALEHAFRSSQRLAVYGTLAPGEANHHLLAACPGPWIRGVVHGHRAMREHAVFTYDAAAGHVAVQMLTSPGLLQRWASLDEFERPTHRRVLVPVFEGKGLLSVANLYEACEPVEPA